MNEVHNLINGSLFEKVFSQGVEKTSLIRLALPIYFLEQYTEGYEIFSQ
jgi:hypothetical protein